MSEIRLNVPVYKFQYIFTHYIRHALACKDCSSIVATEDIKTYWNLLISDTRNAIIHDIQHEIELTKSIGITWDNIDLWQELLDWIAEQRSVKTAQPLNDYLPVVDPKLIGK